MTQRLYKLPYDGDVHCLTFDEYVDMLEVTSTLNSSSIIDNHIRPQHIYCPSIFESIVQTHHRKAKPIQFVGNISRLFEVLETLKDVFPLPINQTHHHSSKVNTTVLANITAHEATLNRLCKLALPEYVAMGDWNGMEKCIVAGKETLRRTGL